MSITSFFAICGRSKDEKIVCSLGITVEAAVDLTILSLEYVELPSITMSRESLDGKRPVKSMKTFCHGPSVSLVILSSCMWF